MRLWTFFVSLFLSFSLIIFPPVEAKQIKSSVKTSEVIKKTSSVNEIKKSQLNRMSEAGQPVQLAESLQGQVNENLVMASVVFAVHLTHS